jgi:hypothetical protein
LLPLGSSYKDNRNFNNGNVEFIGKEKNNDHIAYAHYFGATKVIDKYQIVFQPFPFVPFVGDNSTTLNFSILDNNNSNVNNVYAALVIKEKNTDKVIGQVPYKFYEFSDNPLISNFDISVNNLQQIIPFSKLMLYYVTPSTAVVAGISVYLISKKKANNKSNNELP